MKCHQWYKMQQFQNYHFYKIIQYLFMDNFIATELENIGRLAADIKLLGAITNTIGVKLRRSKLKLKMIHINIKQRHTIIMSIHQTSGSCVAKNSQRPGSVETVQGDVLPLRSERNHEACLTHYINMSWFFSFIFRKMCVSTSCDWI